MSGRTAYVSGLKSPYISTPWQKKKGCAFYFNMLCNVLKGFMSRVQHLHVPRASIQPL